MISDGSPAADHDEDCNPCTVAGLAPDGDADSDLYPSRSCTNPWLGDEAPLGCDANRTDVDETLMTVHGADCNDDASMEAQAPIGQRGAKEIAAEILAALAVVTAHLGRRFEVEAIHTGLAFPAGLAVVVGVSALGSVLVCAAACGRAGEGHRKRVLHGTVVLEGPALEELLHALGDGRAERLELGARGRSDGREGTEHGVHAVNEQHVALLPGAAPQTRGTFNARSLPNLCTAVMLPARPSAMPSSRPLLRYQPSITRAATACTASVRSWW